jgi:hypothetical protein
MRTPWLVALALTLGSCERAPSAPAPAAAPTVIAASRPAPLALRRTCCKVCKKGKPCGDSCIAKTKECHQPPGCAC